MSEIDRAVEGEVVDMIAAKVRDELEKVGTQTFIAAGQKLAVRIFAKNVSKHYARELAQQIVANPGASSSFIFLKTMSSLSRNAQTTARVMNAAAPVVGRYLAVLVDPAVKAIKMARDDESHSAREYFVEMTKSTVVGAVKTGASASLGPLGGLAASMAIDKVAERLEDYITST